MQKKKLNFASFVLVVFFTGFVFMVVFYIATAHYNKRPKSMPEHIRVTNASPVKSKQPAPGAKSRSIQKTNAPKTQAAAPQPQVEIISKRWYFEPEWAGRGATIWLVEVQNNTGHIIPYLKVTFTTYDCNGSIIDTDFGIITNLSPLQSQAKKGYAKYTGREHTAKFQIIQR